MSFFRCGGANKSEDSQTIENWWMICTRTTGNYSVAYLDIYYNGEQITDVEAAENMGTGGPFYATFNSIANTWTVKANSGYNITFCSEELPVSWSSTEYKAILCLCE